MGFNFFQEYFKVNITFIMLTHNKEVPRTGTERHQKLTLLLLTKLFKNIYIYIHAHSQEEGECDKVGIFQEIA